MKKALALWGGWEGHEPKQCTDRVVAALEKEGFEIEVTNDLNVYADEAKLKSKDLIIQCVTMGEISPEQTVGLLKAISSGVGFGGWHGGMCDSFRTNTEYQWMTGGNWVAHPGGIIEYEVNITDFDDPITEDLNTFKMKSEQYYLHTDPSNDVLATTTFAGSPEFPWIGGCVMPQVWKRSFGEGRVFYSALGHVAADFDVPEVMAITTRGLAWASR